MAESHGHPEATSTSSEERSRPVAYNRTREPLEGVLHSHLDTKIRPYIDLVDSLRMTGIDKDLALPAIVIIGDQSSGKSSVLEALSGVGLPRGSGIVTRCPLQLKLRKASGGSKWRAIISYKNNCVEFDSPSLVEDYVSKAQNELTGGDVGISDELISLEIKSPDVCDLTLIDLPGITRVPVGGQPEDIADQIKTLIRSFIENSETIILVVVPCNVDIATTEALKMAQTADSDGQRTLAILTKPDLVDKGTEKNVMEIIQNKVIPLKKGYIMVKCRGQKQIDDKLSLVEAIRVEKEFFSSHPVFGCLLYEKRATMSCLASKLTLDLVDHIKMSLPSLCEKIKQQLWYIKNELKYYEKGPPLDPQNRKMYLIRMITNFNDKVNQLGEINLGNGNIFVCLRLEFKKWKQHLDSTKNTFTVQVQEVVDEYDKKHRGRELPGFCDYSIFENVVQRLVSELKDPAVNTLTVSKDAVQEQFINVAKTCFTSFPFLQGIVLDKIASIQSKQEARAMKRISEQFEMEKLVYTQDDTYYKAMMDTLEGNEKISEENCGSFDRRTYYTKMLQSYYEVVIQRLADQVPMLIRLFVLKESARLLCCEMLSLTDGSDGKELLQEEKETSRRRSAMEERLKRLSMAQNKISNFF